jgi:hypothetical protein
VNTGGKVTGVMKLTIQLLVLLRSGMCGISYDFMAWPLIGQKDSILYVFMYVLSSTASGQSQSQLEYKQQQYDSRTKQTRGNKNKNESG